MDAWIKKTDIYTMLSIIILITDIYTMEYHLAMRGDKFEFFVDKQMDL